MGDQIGHRRDGGSRDRAWTESKEGRDPAHVWNYRYLVVLRRHLGGKQMQFVDHLVGEMLERPVDASL